VITVFLSCRSPGVVREGVEEATLSTGCRRGRQGQRKQAGSQLRVTMTVGMQLRAAMVVSLDPLRQLGAFADEGLSCVIHGPCGVGCGATLDQN
jgi:hypothetical protein